MNVLWFFLGTMLGSAFGFVVMALFQMHRINDYEEQIPVSYTHLTLPTKA